MGNMQLMIVDDEERFLTTTQSLFKKKGINTFTATNGYDAINIVEKEHVDVVILDVRMPGLDGLEALRVIKKTHPLVEVIILTGYASPETAAEALSLGAFDYLVKPCDVSTLLKKANEAYDKKKDAETNYPGK